MINCFDEFFFSYYYFLELIMYPGLFKEQLMFDMGKFQIYACVVISIMNQFQCKRSDACNLFYNRTNKTSLTWIPFCHSDRKGALQCFITSALADFPEHSTAPFICTLCPEARSMRRSNLLHKRSEIFNHIFSYSIFFH